MLLTEWVPIKLPPDWKETINRVVRSNVSPDASPRIPQRNEMDEAPQVLPPMKATVQLRPQTKKDDACTSAHAVAETWSDKSEHATTVRIAFPCVRVSGINSVETTRRTPLL